MRSQHTGVGVDTRKTTSFHSRAAKTRYWVLFALISSVGVGCALLLLTYKNPMPFGTEQFWLIAYRRLHAVTAMLLVAICQALATVAFQTVANNRIITPSIMGFESLYRVIHTTTVFFFGAAGLIAADNLGMFVVQLVLMVGLSLLLYSWLLTSKSANIHAMLLVGIVIGGGLGSVATFMQRMLTPSDFDVLLARLFGSVNNADPDYFPISALLIALAGGFIVLNGKNLNVLALGREATMNLGIEHKRLSVGILIAVAVLMAVSTALVGPMTFLGFLVATLAYQAADTYDHRLVFPMTVAISFSVLTSAYFIMNHIFYAQGVVSIIIELVGGSVFLIVLMKRGRL